MTISTQVEAPTVCGIRFCDKDGNPVFSLEEAMEHVERGGAVSDYFLRLPDGRRLNVYEVVQRLIPEGNVDSITYYRFHKGGWLRMTIALTDGLLRILANEDDSPRAHPLPLRECTDAEWKLVREMFETGTDGKRQLNVDELSSCNLFDEVFMNDSPQTGAGASRRAAGIMRNSLSTATRLSKHAASGARSLLPGAKRPEARLIG